MTKATVMAPTTCLGMGGGIDAASVEYGIDEFEVNVIGIDGGSLDHGAYYLGTGTPKHARGQVKEDLETIIPIAKEYDIPVIIGTAGGSGARPHAKWNLKIIEEIASEQDLAIDVTTVGTDVDQNTLENLRQNRDLEPIKHDKALQKEDIENSDEVVATIGVETMVEALKTNPDVLLAGRSCDNAVMGSYPVSVGIPKGLALHMGNILECGNVAAETKPGRGHDPEENFWIPMIGEIDEEGFTIQPTHEAWRCTDISIAGHSLYERRDPYRSTEPGGVLDTSECSYENISENAVRVTGSKFIDEEPYTVKVEGAGSVGHRSLSIFGIRDPVMIEQLPEIVDELKTTVDNTYGERFEHEAHFRIYGKNGCMGELEPNDVVEGHEVGVLVEAVGETQAQAHEVCDNIWSRLAFWDYDGRVSTAGNLAFPLSPMVMDGGEVVTLTVYHAAPVESHDELFTYNEMTFPTDSGVWG